MLFDLTDEEITTIGQYRWIKKNFLKELILAGITLFWFGIMARIKPDELSLTLSILYNILATGPTLIYLIIYLIKIDKAGKSFIKEIKGESN